MHFFDACHAVRKRIFAPRPAGPVRCNSVIALTAYLVAEQQPPAKTALLNLRRRAHVSTSMRTRCRLLLLMLLAVVFVSSRASGVLIQETEATSENPLPDGPIPARSLRGEGPIRLLLSPSEEERMPSAMGVKEAIGWLWNAVKMKLRIKFWLYRGTTPEKVLEKLKVTSKTDKNYKYYARYYFRYYVRYPGRMPKNAPTKTVDAIMKARQQDWLDKNLSPPQVFKELGFSGTFASAQGHPDYKYFEQYSRMWSALQARISNEQVKAADTIMKARLQNYLDKNLSPPQVFKELGFSGTFASAQGHPDYKYFEQYSRMWRALQDRISNEQVKAADTIMKARLQNYLDKNLSPPQVFKELGLSGTFASAQGHPDYKYFEQYSRMWSDLQVRISNGLA